MQNLSQQSRDIQIENTILDKKLNDLLIHRDLFINEMINYIQNLCPEKIEIDDEQDRILEGRDIRVCIRARPLLNYEIKHGYYDVVYAQQPFFHFLEPKLNVANQPVLQNEKHLIDHAFSQNDDNDIIYKSVIYPLLDLCFAGGFSSIFTYGQTGSGKTYTIQGILQRIAYDIFQRNSKDKFEIYVSFFQILGNDSSDLLNEKSAIKIGEDKFGQVEILNLREVLIQTPDDLIQLNQKASNNRETAKTFKNDSSSRSHSVCKFKIVNKIIKSMEPGEFYLFDLAGSENTADSQFHDKALIMQTKEINKSLMALKECMRNRALCAMNPQKSYHIPYRNSKLTLLLKQSFELSSRKKCKTVIFANVSPSVSDIAMTKNTLRFIAPIKIGAKEKVKEKVIDPNNPADWSNEELKNWVQNYSRNQVNPNLFCPYESGKQLMSLSETELMSRLVSQGIPERQALLMITDMWELLICSRAKNNKNMEIAPPRLSKMIQLKSLKEIQPSKTILEIQLTVTLAMEIDQLNRQFLKNTNISQFLQKKQKSITLSNDMKILQAKKLIAQTFDIPFKPAKMQLKKTDQNGNLLNLLSADEKSLESYKYNEETKENGYQIFCFYRTK